MLTLVRCLVQLSLLLADAAMELAAALAAGHMRQSGWALEQPFCCPLLLPCSR